MPCLPPSLASSLTAPLDSMVSRCPPLMLSDLPACPHPVSSFWNVCLCPYRAPIQTPEPTLISPSIEEAPYGQRDTHQVVKGICQLLGHLQFPAGRHQVATLAQVRVNCSQVHKFLHHDAWGQEESGRGRDTGAQQALPPSALCS